MSFATACSSWRRHDLAKLHPNDELGRRFGDPDRRGWHDVLPVRLVQVPVFGAVIVANMVVARFVKDPTNPRFIWRAVPIQLSGLFVLIAGNLLWPHVWLWSVLGTSLYAFGIGLNLPDAVPLHAVYQQPAERNRVGLAEHGHSGGDGRFVEIGRGLWFNGGRIPFHLLAVIAGVAVVFTLKGLLTRVRQYHATELATEK